MLAVAERFLKRAPAGKAEAPPRPARLKADERQLSFDLFMQVSYMAALASAKVSRSVLFKKASALRLASTPYFRDVQTLADRLSMDYAQACRIVAERTTDIEVSGLLLRMAGSLASGEEEAEFLTREAEVLAEQYSERYERDVESIKKWTDAYSALVVSVGLIVVISIISMMIYQTSTLFLLGTSLMAIVSVSVGAWVIYLSSPKESFTRVAGLSSSRQKMALLLFRTVVPAAAAMGALAWLAGGGIGAMMVIVGAALMAPGFIMATDARRRARKDADIATMARLLGGVTAALGTTVTEALGKIDRRSMGALQHDIKVLEIRLKAGLRPDLCWRRFVDDIGSELVDRTTKIFTDALDAGGDPAQVGGNASFFAQRIALLREKRMLVAATFGYLVPLVHASVVGLLIFIVKVLGMFSTTLAEQTPDVSAESSAAASAIPSLGLQTFTMLDVGFLNMLVLTNVIALTVANAAAPSVAAGGHKIRMAFTFGIMMLISGGMLIILPKLAQGIFNKITALPV